MQVSDYKDEIDRLNRELSEVKKPLGLTWGLGFGVWGLGFRGLRFRFLRFWV